MISKNELIAQLRGRRRSVEAEIKRVQEEQPIDATRAATNDGYLMALKIELSFITDLLAQNKTHRSGDWFSEMIAEVIDKRKQEKQQKQQP